MLSKWFKQENHPVMRTEHSDFGHLPFIQSSRSSCKSAFQTGTCTPEHILTFRETRNTQAFGDVHVK